MSAYDEFALHLAERARLLEEHELRRSHREHAFARRASEPAPQPSDEPVTRRARPEPRPFGMLRRLLPRRP